MPKFLLLFLGLFVLIRPAALAQDGPSRGMVWHVPEGNARAESDLYEMARVGVNAVRTDYTRGYEYLDDADSLGIEVYVDLPLSRLPASVLHDSLNYATDVLDTLLALARDHASLRNIGLARFADTSDSTACRYFQQLAARVRAGAPAGTRSYYTTQFVDDDVCSGHVDFVLVDARNHENPSALLHRWAENDKAESPLGIGALGTWVRGDSLGGLNVHASSQRQARYFERHLPVLLSDTSSSEVPVVFVHRWKDYRNSYPGTAHDLDDPYVQRYGLHEADGTPRPALAVVTGIFTGRQFVFAFKDGNPPPSDAPWTTLLGWGIIAVLASFYALSPRFRHMVPRYFQAHFFFRESVREGRDVLFGTSTALLGAQALASGLIAFVVLDAVRGTDTFVLLVRWFPVSLQGAFVTLLATPWVLVILTGCFYLLALLVWTLILSLCSRRKYPVAPAQALMLVVWPRWPMLLIMAAAMALASAPEVNIWAYVVLIGVWIAVEIVACIRTLIDLIAVTRIPGPYVIPCVLLAPCVVVLAAVAILALSNQPEVTFLWHTMTRS